MPQSARRALQTFARYIWPEAEERVEAQNEAGTHLDLMPRSLTYGAVNCLVGVRIRHRSEIDVQPVGNLLPGLHDVAQCRS